MSLLGCCSINLAVSNIVLVNAPPDVLWDVLKDFEALSQILDYTVQSVKVSLPPSTQIIVSQSQSEDKNKSIQVGTQIHEVRVLKKNKNTLTDVSVAHHNERLHHDTRICSDNHFIVLRSCHIGVLDSSFFTYHHEVSPLSYLSSTITSTNYGIVVDDVPSSRSRLEHQCD